VFRSVFSSKCSLDNDFSSGDPFSQVKQRTDATLSSIYIRESAVRKELRRLDVTKATGPDGVPARVLRECADELARPLSRLFSLCYRKKKQPALWKTARVVPVYKKKTRSAPSNYRPVSLLCIPSKVMEGIINRQIVNFLEREKVLSSQQFGFRRGLGTSDLLIQLRCEWATTASHGGGVHAVAVDISGAFDKVSHSGVLYKAEKCGLGEPLLGWLADYLRQRQLRVAVGGQESAAFPISAGVPEAP